MKKLFVILAFLGLLFNCVPCGDMPDSYNGAEKTGCSYSDDDEITCCSYESASCIYILCRDCCYCEIELVSWGCY